MVINKKQFLDAFSCLKLGWINSHNTNNSIAEDDYDSQLKILEGIEIGKTARKLFPNGKLIDEKEISSAITKTKNMLADTSIKIIFEAAFSVEDFIARPDILIRNTDNSLEIIEVKSSVNDKPELVDDISYTGMILQLAGLSINKYSLMLISKDYRLGMNYKNMFKTIDHTEDVKQRINEMLEKKKIIASALLQNSSPAGTLIYQCRQCDYLDTCFPEYAKIESIFNLPRLSEKQFDELKTLGIKSIKEIPDYFKLNSTQLLAKRSIIENKIIKTNDLNVLLEDISWPIYYLDFESMMTAIPLYKNTAPYTQIPTQFSIHYVEKLNKPSIHFEYLSSKIGDCRNELADNLITYLGLQGTIFSYSSFEKTIIKGLIELFPGKETKLQAIIDRIYDLEAIVKCLYHPEFRGSYSIKKTLPALVPSLNYDDLDIHNGSMAMSVFALMIKGIIDPSKEEKIRTSLLKYCERDTLAMVRLHEEIMKL
jgi:predicted RecB family nuclease